MIKIFAEGSSLSQKLFFFIQLTWKQWRELCIRGGSDWILDFFFFSTGRLIGIQIRCLGSGVTIFAQQESGCDTWGMVYVWLWQGWGDGWTRSFWRSLPTLATLGLCPYLLHHRRDPHGVVTRLGLVEPQNRPGVLRLGLAEQLCWIWHFLEITAEIWP